MKNILQILGFLSLVVMAAPAFAQENGGTHTANFCSTQDASICAHLYIPAELITQTESKFNLHILTPQDEPISDLKVDIWMQMGTHGHGSAPLKISPTPQANEFSVNNGWFVMPGTWLVRTWFSFHGQAYQISIPVQINQ